MKISIALSRIRMEKVLLYEDRSMGFAMASDRLLPKQSKMAIRRGSASVWKLHEEFT